MGENADQGVAEVQGELKALRNDYARDLQRVESRLARVEGSRESKEEEEDGDGASSVAGQHSHRPRQRREFPELATLEPASDDQDVFGDAWALVQDWRKLKETHPNRGKGLEWLREKERLLAVELALLEDHGLTLPPETYPLRGLDRGAQVNWRQKALVDTQKARKKQEMLYRVRQILSPWLWRK